MLNESLNAPPQLPFEKRANRLKMFIGVLAQAYKPEIQISSHFTLAEELETLENKFNKAKDDNDNFRSEVYQQGLDGLRPRSVDSERITVIIAGNHVQPIIVAGEIIESAAKEVLYTKIVTQGYYPQPENEKSPKLNWQIALKRSGLSPKSFQHIYCYTFEVSDSFNA